MLGGGGRDWLIKYSIINIIRNFFFIRFYSFVLSYYIKLELISYKFQIIFRQLYLDYFLT